MIIVVGPISSTGSTSIAQPIAEYAPAILVTMPTEGTVVGRVQWAKVSGDFTSAVVGCARLYTSLSGDQRAATASGRARWATVSGDVEVLR